MAKRVKPRNSEVLTEDFRQNLADHLEAVRLSGKRVVVKWYRKPVAALVSYDDLLKLEQCEKRVA